MKAQHQIEQAHAQKYIYYDTGRRSGPTPGSAYEGNHTKRSASTAEQIMHNSQLHIFTAGAPNSPLPTASWLRRNLLMSSVGKTTDPFADSLSLQALLGQDSSIPAHLELYSER